jgi:hypothetical protein
MKTNVEVEHGEIAIKNKNGDIVIVPKEKSLTVRKMIESSMHSSIDAIVATLPTIGDKAQDGKVIGVHIRRAINDNRNMQATEFPLPDAVKNSDKQIKVPFQRSAFDMKKIKQDEIDNIEQPPTEEQYSRDPNEEKFYFTDRRKTHPVTDSIMNPNRDLMSGFYSKPLVREIIRQSKKMNVNPNRQIALAMQETNIGKTDENIGHYIHDVTKLPITIPEGYSDEQANIYRMIYKYKEMQSKDKDFFYNDHKMTDEQFNSYDIDTWRIQAYNGLGKLTPKTEYNYHTRTNRTTTRFYNIDVTKKPLDLKENPAYAKTILSLESQIKKDPDFQKLINENISNEQKLLNHIN